MSAQPHSSPESPGQQDQQDHQEAPQEEREVPAPESPAPESPASELPAPERPAPARPAPARPARRGPAWPRRVALVVIAALAGLSYAWAASQATLEFYYAAAVRSMAASWHNFIFAALDPAGTISLDKLPGAFWLQALAVRAFGFHTWVIILPQVAEGVLTVLVLYRAVSRLAGPAAGLIAALILAASPATVALNRGNISDSLMVLLLVLAADAVSAAIARWGTSGTLSRLILAAFWVGLAFQAKMIEAWLVLPALGLAYLIDGPGKWPRRVIQLVAAGIVAGIVSLAWITAVSLVPASQRPYADGSSNDSVYSQVFVYNGFGRFGDQTPVQLLVSQVAPDMTLPMTHQGHARLLSGDIGRDTGWLLPAAVLAGLWGIVSRSRRPRRDGPRACFVLWGAWLLILGVTFSVTTYIQTYYTAALTPAIAAILGTAAACILVPRPARGASEASTASGASDAGKTGEASVPAPGVRGGLARKIGLAVVSAGTTAYAVWLIPAQGAHLPDWLVNAVIAAGAVAVVVIIGWVFIRRAAVAAAAVAIAVVAALVVPAVASAGLVANHESAFDAPFEPVSYARLLASVPGRLAMLQRVSIPRLEKVQGAAPDLLATQTAYLAAVFIYTSGREALPIGGFDGTTPSPTLNQLKADIARGQFHLVIALADTDPRVKWIAAHCRHLSAHNFYCLPSDAS